jgi:hypothetical protein
MTSLTALTGQHVWRPATGDDATRARIRSIPFAEFSLVFPANSTCTGESTDCSRESGKYRGNGVPKEANAEPAAVHGIRSFGEIQVSD